MNCVECQRLNNAKNRPLSDVIGRPIDPSKYYEGQACNKCGGTTRYKGPPTRCVPCQQARSRKYNGVNKTYMRPVHG